jgi:hypothetical protein
MDKKKLLIIAILSFVPFLFYLTSSGLIDGDSFYYLNSVCNNTQGTASSYLFVYILDFLPCDLFLIKLFYFLLYFASMIILTKIVELFSKNSEYTPFLVSATFLVFEFMKFENDAFGYLLGFLAIYLFFKYRGWRKIYSIISLFVAFLFWEGAGYWLILFPVWFIAFSLIYFNRFWWFVTNTEASILEHIPWIGFLNYGLLLPLFYIGFLNTKENKIKITFLLLVLINVFVSKLWVLALPFGLIIACNSIGFLKEKWDYQVKNFVLISGMVFIVFTLFFSLTQPFTEKDIVLIQNGVNLACLKNDCWLENDFSVGHTIHYLGGKTKSHSGLTEYKYQGIVIDINSSKNIVPIQCDILEETRFFRLIECKQ